jgi:hypothetical protein
MALRTAKSDRDVRTLSTGSRVDLGTRYVNMFGVACCRKSDRDVRTRSTGFRVDLGTRCVTMFGVACCRKEWGKAL